MRPAELVRRSPKRRWQALWVAVYALGLLLSTAHFNLVAHRICEEHGEVEHAGVEAPNSCDAEEAVAQNAALAPTPSADHADSPNEHAPQEDERHEHCELDPATQAAPEFELAPLTFAEWLDEHVGQPAPPAPRAPAIAILRLAPGHSPPRA